MSANPTAPSRPDRFAVQLAEKLATIEGAAERRKFLNRQHDNWIARYENWQAAVDCGRIELTGDHATAWDYVETIAIIDKARFEYVKEFA